jgi:hypothetical protein
MFKKEIFSTRSLKLPNIITKLAEKYLSHANFIINNFQHDPQNTPQAAWPVDGHPCNGRKAGSGKAARRA